MSHYEERLERDLERIRNSIGNLGAQVSQALRNAMQAVLENDREIASETVIGDYPINRASRRIDRLCHAFIARHLPSAGHLRLMSSVIRANVALERIGDYAVTICREAMQLTEPPPPRVAKQLEAVADRALPLLDDAIAAFNDGNVEAARTLMVIPEQLESGMDDIYESLIDRAKKRRLRETVAEFVIFSMLKRVSDQAKNICDQTVFSVTGKIKPTKTFRILIVDDSNSCLSRMAEAIALKRYPSSAAYTSAGLDPATKMDPDLTGFLDSRGISIEATEPEGMESLQDQIHSYDIIVGLGVDMADFVEHLPFHTTVFRWEIVEVAGDVDEQRKLEIFEENFRILSMKIEDLMYTLIGDDAD